jgi:hypothetical protein
MLGVASDAEGEYRIGHEGGLRAALNRFQMSGVLLAAEAYILFILVRPPGEAGRRKEFV